MVKQSVKQPRFSWGQLWSVRSRKRRWSRIQSWVSRREKRSSYTKRSTRDSTHFQMPTEDYMRWNGRTVHATKTVSLSLSLQRYDRAFWKTCSWTVHDHEPSHGFYLWCTWPPNHSVEWHYTESRNAWTICHCHHRKRSSSRQLFWLCWWLMDLFVVDGYDRSPNQEICRESFTMGTKEYVLSSFSRLLYLVGSLLICLALWVSAIEQYYFNTFCKNWASTDLNNLMQFFLRTWLKFNEKSFAYIRQYIKSTAWSYKFGANIRKKDHY